VRAIGRFLEDPVDVPWQAVEYTAAQLGIDDSSCLKRYTERPHTPYEHAWDIRRRYGYRQFEDPDASEDFARFLDGRAWTQAEGPVTLFEHAVGWLRRHRVLLLGVTVLARRVASAREAAETRRHRTLADAAGKAGSHLPAHLAELLLVPEGSRLSALERLCRALRFSEAGDNARVRVETSADGRAWLHVEHLDALVELDSLVWLRKTAQTMLPRVDRPSERGPERFSGACPRRPRPPAWPVRPGLPGCQLLVRCRGAGYVRTTWRFAAAS
jgi:hypothetical protein